MNHTQLTEYVIKPVLQSMDADSESAVTLLLMTCAQESRGGEYLHQLGGGPALGIFQMEPHTHDLLWTRFLRGRPKLAQVVRSWEIPGAFDADDANEMVGNLYYAAAMCRVFYLDIPERLPKAGDIAGMAQYYKRYYNTAAGAATIRHAMKAYEGFVK